MKRLILVSSIAALVFMLSCEETEDGCLDLLSSNYDVHAVNACDSCCTYPTARFNYRVDYDTFLSRGLLDTFFLANNDTFFLHDLELALTNFSFGNNDTDSFQVIDSIRINSDFVLDDYLYVDGTGTFNVGDLRSSGVISTISFSLGESADVIDSYEPFTQIDQDSNLDELIDSMYVEDIESLLSVRMELQLADSIRTLEISSTDAIPLSYSVEKEILLGEPILFDIRIDVAQLIGENNSNSTDDELKATILRNIADAITAQ